MEAMLLSNCHYHNATRRECGDPVGNYLFRNAIAIQQLELLYLLRGPRGAAVLGLDRLRDVDHGRVVRIHERPVLALHEAHVDDFYPQTQPTNRQQHIHTHVGVRHIGDQQQQHTLPLAIRFDAVPCFLRFSSSLRKTGSTTPVPPLSKMIFHVSFSPDASSLYPTITSQNTQELSNSVPIKLRPSSQSTGRRAAKRTGATRPEMLQAPKIGWLNFSSVMSASGISW